MTFVITAPRSKFGPHYNPDVADKIASQLCVGCCFSNTAASLLPELNHNWRDAHPRALEKALAVRRDSRRSCHSGVRCSPSAMSATGKPAALACADVSNADQ